MTTLCDRVGAGRLFRDTVAPKQPTRGSGYVGPSVGENLRTKSSDNVGDRFEHEALAAPARVLCDVRLVTLSLLIVISAVQMQHLDIEFWTLLLAVPMSWIPLRLWARQPEQMSQGWQFPLADAIITGVIAGFGTRSTAGAAITALYLAESAILIGMTARRNIIAMWGGAFLGTFLVAQSTPYESWPNFWWAPIILAGFMWFASVLGQKLRESGKLARQAIATQARDAAESERLAIARDLHDSLAKSVHGMRMLAEALRDELAAEKSRHLDLANLIFQSADDASREARIVLDGLRGGGAEQIEHRLEALTWAWAARTGVIVSVHLQGSLDERRPNAEWQWAITQVLGELLTNVEKHAAASFVWVFIHVAEVEFLLAVEDDGRGLSSEITQRPELALQGHYGIAGISERLARLGGTLELSRREAGGTRAVVRVPLREETR